jgi:hypothetical protein
MTQEVFNRLLVEFQENGERTNKLREFILNAEEFEKLDNLNRDLMIAQLKAMEAYLSTLSIRIGLNAKQSEDSAEIIEETTNE